MAFKYFLLAAFVAAAANASYQGDAEYDPHPQYSFGYDVQDGLTGDSKSQQETRDGDVVKGHYSLLESDGTRRTVHYTADPINGFNAVVDKKPAAVAVASVVKTVAAPAHLVKTVAPLAYNYQPAYKTVAAAAPLVQSYQSYPAYKTVSSAAPLAYSSFQYASPYYTNAYAHSAPALKYSTGIVAPAVSQSLYSSPLVSAYSTNYGYAQGAYSPVYHH